MTIYTIYMYVRVLLLTACFGFSDTRTFTLRYCFRTPNGREKQSTVVIIRLSRSMLVTQCCQHLMRRWPSDYWRSSMAQHGARQRGVTSFTYSGRGNLDLASYGRRSSPICGFTKDARCVGNPCQINVVYLLAILSTTYLYTTTLFLRQVLRQQQSK